MPQPLAPISAPERLSVIDALRGFAVLGILLMNVKLTSFPPAFEGLWVQGLDGLAAAVTYWTMEFLVHGKFFTMFTFLFGLGMAVQVSRAIAKGNEKKFAGAYVRRLLLLLAIGLIHDIFFWYGSVLLWYPVMGFFLLLFRKFKPKLMLTMGLVFILVTCGVSTVRFAMSRPSSPPVKVQKKEQPPAAQKGENTPEDRMKKRRARNGAVIKLYKEGSYMDTVRDRLKKVPVTLMRNLGIGWFVLGMFLLGAWGWRKGVFHDLDKHAGFLRKVFWFSLVIGVLFTAVIVQARIWGGGSQPGVWGHFLITFVRWSGFAALCISYVTGFMLLYRKASFKKLAAPLEAVGRMALSNYMFQNLLAAFVFYNFGLKLIGETGPFMNLLICLAIYAVQIPLSVWWLKKYRFGPAEWLWRSLTYGKRQPMMVGKT